MKTASKKKTPITSLKSASRANSTSSSRQSKTEYSIDESVLMKLFEDELKDIYWAEKALTKALPKMAKNATAPELIEALQNHLAETEQQVMKVEQVFASINKKPQTKKCEAMEGLIKEGDEIMKDSKKGSMRDAGIISAGQKIEHYEIASYGTLRTFATVLGLSEAADTLQEILSEEKAADEKLTEVAENTINVNASKEME